MTSLSRESSLNLYTLFFSPTEWATLRRAQNVNPYSVALWFAAAIVSQVVGNMLVLNAYAQNLAVWIIAGMFIKGASVTAAAFLVTSFISVAVSWRWGAQVSSRSIFCIVLLAYMPALLATPLALVMLYVGHSLTLWFIGKLILSIWTLVLLYTGVTGATGISGFNMVLVILVSIFFVVVSVFLTFFWFLFLIAA